MTTSFLTRCRITSPAFNGFRQISCTVLKYADSSESSSKNSAENINSPLKSLLNESCTLENAVPSSVNQQWATLSYPRGARIRKQGEFYRKPKHDPQKTSVIMFPGQGSQYVGMAKNLLQFPLAKDLFELANHVLNYDLLKLCLEGPKDKLDQTQYCQPAVLVTSLAALEKLKEERPNVIENCVAAAGFSLGEITALIFAGAIGFERGLHLVKIRGEAMQLASEIHKGGMVTVLYGPDSKLNYACLRAKEWAVTRGDEFPECQIANYLFPHCKVVSGSESAIGFLETNYKEFHLRKVKRLPVSGPFHCNLMLPAVEPFKKALIKSEINDPIISVYSNVDGNRYKHAAHIKKQLPRQIVQAVKWEQLLHVVYERDQDEHFPRTFEVGPGNSLKAILKQVNAKAWNSCYTIEI